jgi:DNA-binding CsgD family transcriptional regulator
MTTVTDLKTILTVQELKLGQCLVKGLSLRKSAIAMGITYETARDKLKTIYQKTGTNSQVQLALLIDRNERSFEGKQDSVLNGNASSNLFPTFAEDS